MNWGRLQLFAVSAFLVFWPAALTRSCEEFCQSGDERGRYADATGSEQPGDVVYDYNSMPYFAYPNQGTLIVTDQGSGGLSVGFGRRITGGSTRLSRRRILAISCRTRLAYRLTPSVRARNRYTYADERFAKIGTDALCLSELPSVIVATVRLREAVPIVRRGLHTLYWRSGGKDRSTFRRRHHL